MALRSPRRKHTPVSARRPLTRWSWRSPELLLYEHVIRRIRCAMKCAGFIASPLVPAADRVNPLHRRHTRERTAPAARHHLKLEQRDVLWRCAWRIAGDLGDHRAAIHVLPVRAGVVAADGLAVREQRSDRLAENPRELA